MGAALVLGLGAQALRSPDEVAGRVAPAITLPDLRNASATVDLKSFRGRPVVVNFFASWCAPCKRELPALQDAHRAAGEKVAFLGVAHQDDRDLAIEMLAKAGITYPAGFDPDGAISRRYRLRGLPSTAFVDGQGRLVGVAAGELDADDLREWLDRLVAP